MRSFERYTGHHCDGRITYHVRIYSQPVWRRAVAGLYHWYDMRIRKVPGMRWLDQHLYNWQPVEKFIPMFARQDLRCYHLSQKGRTELAEFEVDAEQYEHIGAAKRR